MDKENFDFRVIEIKRVAKVTEGGKKMKIRAFVVIGNFQGKVGYAVAKGGDPAEAVAKAKKLAEKNLITVPIIDGTVPYEIKEKLGATQILLKPAKKGKGLIAGGSVRTVLSLAGYTDAVAKILGVTKNPLVNTLVVFKALERYKDYEKKLKLKEKIFTKKDANSSIKDLS